MIYVKRSVDIEKDVLWVAAELNEETRRGRQLYLGKDVNGAVNAAVAAGMPRLDAEAQARSEVERCQSDAINDNLVGAK